jgi:hypothetical protein
MSPELQTAIISSSITFLGTLFITLLAIKLQRGRKVIQYTIKSMPLLRFKPMEGTLSISVDKFILTNEESDKGTSQQINNTYGFQIDLFNVGSEDIEKPNIEITLDPTAKIVGYETQPANRPGYEVNLQRINSQPNVLRVLFPFVNRGEPVTIRLISTDNATKQCKVGVLGLGIHAKVGHPDRSLLLLLLPILIPLTLALLLLLPPNSAIIYLVGHENSRAILPDWFTLLFLLISLVTFAIPVINLIRVMITRFKKSEIEWEDKEVQLDPLTFLRKLFSS